MSSCEILRTNLKMYKRGTLTNGSENKKIDNDAQGFTYKRRKEGRRGLTSNEDSVDASIQGLEDDIKVSKERLIIVASNS